jgi:hypothetical protein
MMVGYRFFSFPQFIAMMVLIKKAVFSKASNNESGQWIVFCDTIHDLIVGLNQFVLTMRILLRIQS